MTARKDRSIHVFIIYFMAFSLFFTMHPAQAQDDVSRLTKDNVTAFIEETTAMTSGEELSLDQGKVIDYLEKHLHKNARFKSTMKYNIPGFPSKGTSMSLDRKEYMESVKKGAESLSDYKTSIEIQDIKISKKQDKATVYTKSLESGVMPVSNGETTEFTRVNGESSCIQILSLEKGVIQMYNANCTTIISFAEY